MGHVSVTRKLSSLPKQKTAGRALRIVFLSAPAFAGTFMGEEKPDEELMGKRKSSPRLSTTIFYDVDNKSIALL
jgi:hypothetical protein